MNELENATSLERRVNVLKKYDTLGLRDVLRIAFDNEIQIDLPEGAPPYNELESSYKKPPTIDDINNLRVLVKHPINAKIKQLEKERIFIKMLEKLHPEDAKILLAAKDKKLVKNVKGLTKKLVQKTWPNLIKK